MPPANEDLSDYFPDAASRGLAVPVRVGMSNRTGKILIGWDHVAQSIARLFKTRFHERVLRRWLGSFVPHLLGELATRENVVRYFSAISTAIDLWEPCFRVERVQPCDVQGNITGVQDVMARRLRIGGISFRVEGLYMPRGHLGDFTVESRRSIVFIGTGTGLIVRLSA